MKNEIEGIQHVLDGLIMETSLHNLQFQLLEKAFFELSGHLLDAEESKNLQGNYTRALIDGTSALYSLRDSMYNPTRISGFLFEYQSLLQQRLRDLDS